MKTVYILGAGVDCALGLPLADGLLRELAAFVNGEGRGISSTLKAKLGGGRRVRFSFDKYVANQGESFAERILTDSSIASAVESALAKANGSSSGGAAAVQTIIEKLGQIRAANELDEPTAAAVAELAGESAEMADPTMLRMLAEREGVGPEQCLMVGDTPKDREAAQRFGCAFAGFGMSEPTDDPPCFTEMEVLAQWILDQS